MDEKYSRMRKIIVVLVVFMGIMDNIMAENPDYLFMIENACKAPSGHNTQPWLFKIRESEIDIYPDFSKELPVVDPTHRELFVSLGCATENLCIAAQEKGYESDVKVVNDSFIRVLLTKDKKRQSDSLLFSQIAVRQTNKSVYSGKEIPEDSINKLKNISIDPSVSVYFYKRGTIDYEKIADRVYAGNSLQMNDEAFKTELTKWMRYNKRHQNKTRDGLSYATFGAPNVPLFLAKFIMSKAINEKTQNKGDRKKIASASHMVLFTTKDNTVEQWVALGRTLERILLRSTQMGIVNAYLNQPNEESNIAKEMASQLQIANEYPTILIRLGYGRKMPYSLRRDFRSCILPVEKSEEHYLGLCYRVIIYISSMMNISKVGIISLTNVHHACICY